MQAHPLDGKVALVTGAGRDNGRAIAMALAAQGAAVVVNARSNHDEINSVAHERAGAVRPRRLPPPWFTCAGLVHLVSPGRPCM